MAGKAKDPTPRHLCRQSQPKEEESHEHCSGPKDARNNSASRPAPTGRPAPGRTSEVAALTFAFWNGPARPKSESYPYSMWPANSRNGVIVNYPGQRWGTGGRPAIPYPRNDDLGGALFAALGFRNLFCRTVFAQNGSSAVILYTSCVLAVPTQPLSPSKRSVQTGFRILSLCLDRKLFNGRPIRVSY
jgi:hypothetical protein